MTCIHLKACDHTLRLSEWSNTLEKSTITISINKKAKKAFLQIKDQLQENEIACTKCKRRVKEILLSKESNDLFPITIFFLS